MEKKAAKTTWSPMVQVALEQLVPQERRVIDDPVAYRLLPPTFKGFVALCRIAPIRRTLLNLVDRRAPGIHGGILCRKRYITDTVTAALNAGIQSIVILGAGFDTLAYRVTGLESRQVYEVDLPPVIRLKQAALQRLFGRIPAHVKLVPSDLDTQDLGAALRPAGYGGAEPAVFVWEGVTQYITEAAVRRAFEFFQQAPAGSHLVFTYIRQDFIDGRQIQGLEFVYRQSVVRSRLWQFGFDPGSIGAFLGHYSWQEVEQVGHAEYQERYLQPVNRNLSVMEIERAVHAENKQTETQGGHR